jgi:enoyl-CoA hydratase
MTYETIICDKRERIGYITLNRPEMANAVNTQMAQEMVDACQKIKQDESIKVVIITGTGDEAFCSGEDLKQFHSSLTGEVSSLVEIKGFTLPSSITTAVMAVDCPLIAAINGDALGIGLALALSCDLRIASDKSLLGVPDTAHGYISGNGITQWLPRIVGRGKALEMILTAEPIDAQEAYQIGLVHKIVPPKEVIPEAEKLAMKIASRAPIALRYAKEAVHKGMDLTLEQGLRLEYDIYLILHTTKDRTEGIKAFLEKRPPQFKGE